MCAVHQTGLVVTQSLGTIVWDGRPCELLHVPTVCIVESPNQSDRKFGRAEGTALSSTLTLANITNRVFDVSDRDSFVNAFENIADFAAIRQKHDSISGVHQLAIPRLFLHISCHGNDHGIALTSEEFISWQELGSYIQQLASKVGLFDPTVCSAACLLVCMSSCRGLHAAKMATNPEQCPFACIVGCKSDVEWSDALMAFGTFYHQAITKFRSIPRIMKAMNDSALSTEQFEIVTAADVGANGFSDQPVVVVMCRDTNGFRWLMSRTDPHPERPVLWQRDNVYDPDTGQLLLDPTTDGPLDYFDDPHDAVDFMNANPNRPCQVERSAAQEIRIGLTRR